MNNLENNMICVEIIQGTGVPKLSLGQKLYIPCRQQRIVVEASIDELHDIYGDANQTIWHSYDVNGLMSDESFIQTKDKGGRVVIKPFPVEKLSSLLLLNQFPWCNFPTHGHAAYIGDDAFVTLEEARKYIAPSNKKHLRRRLKEALKSGGVHYDGKKWVKNSFLPKLDDLKVYVRNF